MQALQPSGLQHDETGQEVTAKPLLDGKRYRVVRLEPTLPAGYECNLCIGDIVEVRRMRHWVAVVSVVEGERHVGPLQYADPDWLSAIEPLTSGEIKAQMSKINGSQPDATELAIVLSSDLREREDFELRRYEAETARELALAGAQIDIARVKAGLVVRVAAAIAWPVCLIGGGITALCLLL